MARTVSIVIPTFNERDNIVPLVERIHQSLAGVDYEVLFVDDNSQDGTADLARGLGARYPVRVMVRKDRRGLASAVVDGMAETRGDIVAVMDADLQHPPELLPRLLTEVQDGADLAIASRYVKGGGVPGWTLTRRIISKGAIALTHLSLPATRRIKDPMSGYFAFRRAAVESTELLPIGYKILLEIIMEGRFPRVSEVPYLFRARSRGESKLSSKQQIELLKHLWSLMRRTGELARFLKFCLVGGSGVLVNEGLLWLLRGSAGLPLPLASAISVETSIISNFTLNDFFTFADRHGAGGASFVRRLGKFNLVSLAGLGINTGVLLLLTSVFGVHYLLSNLVGIALATLWNYGVNTLWTWR